MEYNRKMCAHIPSPDVVWMIIILNVRVPSTNLCIRLSFLQLELITDLLGTPTMEDMAHACPAARSHMLIRRMKKPSMSLLYSLSSLMTHEAVHLISQMLVFNPVSVYTQLELSHCMVSLPCLPPYIFVFFFSLMILS